MCYPIALSNDINFGVLKFGGLLASGFTGGYSNSSPSDFWFFITLKGCDFNNRSNSSPSDFWFFITLKGCDFNNRPVFPGRKMENIIQQP